MIGQQWSTSASGAMALPPMAEVLLIPNPAGQFVSLIVLAADTCEKMSQFRCKVLRR